MKSLLLHIIILLVFSGCHTPTEHIMKDFKKEPDNIMQNYKVDKFSHSYYTILKYRSRNIALAIKADLVYAQTNTIIIYIETLKMQLSAKDSVGSDTKIATDLLIRTKAGSELYNSIINFREFAELNCINQDKLANIDNLLIDFSEKVNEKNWLYYNFKNTPTIAATTILSKSQSDLKAVGTILLTEIEVEIKK